MTNAGEKSNNISHKAADASLNTSRKIQYYQNNTDLNEYQINYLDKLFKSDESRVGLPFATRILWIMGM